MKCRKYVFLISLTKTLILCLLAGVSLADGQTKILIGQVTTKDSAMDGSREVDSGISTDHLQHNILTLHDAYTLALKNHEQILIAQKEVLKSRFLPKKANSIMLPKVNMYGQYRLYDDDISIDPEIGSFTVPGEADISGFSVPVEVEVGGVTITQAEAHVDGITVPLDIRVDDFSLPSIITVPKEQTGGNLQIVQPLYKGSWKPRKEQAQHAIIRDTENFRQVSQDILLQVAQVYYEVIKSKELVSLSREILELANEEKQVAQTKFEEGAVTEDAVLNADLKISSTRSRLIEYGNRLKLTQQVLRRYIGEDIGAFEVEVPADLPLEGRDLSELVDIALKNRHDYKKVRAIREITRSDLKLAKSRFHPSLESSWDYFFFDNPSYYQDTDYWTLAFQLTVPLYQGGGRYWDVKEKVESIHQAELALRDYKKNIQIEVEQALLQVDTIKGVLGNLRTQEELARKNYDIVFSKFKFGAASTVDLNQAITILNNVKTELTVKTFDFQISLLRLQDAIGLFSREIIPNL